MEYEIKSKVNPYLDEKNVGFGTQEKKVMSMINKENNVNIGPGKYYKTKKNDNKQNNAPFNLMILIPLKIGIKSHIIFYSFKY